MTMEQGGQSMTAEGDVSYAGDTTAMQLAMSAPQLGGDLEMRLVGRHRLPVGAPADAEGQVPQDRHRRPEQPVRRTSAAFTESDPLATFEDFDAGLEEVDVPR